MIMYGGRICLFTYGWIWVQKKNTLYDYQKYLGPDWEIKKAKFKGATTYVSNH
jgi:hypothetical protein